MLFKPFHFHQKNKRRDISSEGLCGKTQQLSAGKHNNYRRENTTTIGGKTQQLSAGKTQQLPAGKTQQLSARKHN
jgi:hypothetical protein